MIQGLEINNKKKKIFKIEKNKYFLYTLNFHNVKIDCKYNFYLKNKINMYNYYLIKKFKKSQGSNFFSYYNLKIELELQKRVFFNGMGQKFLKHFKRMFIFFKHDFFIDPYYIFLFYLEFLSLPIYLHKKWSKKANVPLDLMYKLYNGSRLPSLYRSCKMLLKSFLSLEKKNKLFLKMYYEFVLLQLESMKHLNMLIEYNINALYITYKNVFYIV